MSVCNLPGVLKLFAIPATNCWIFLLMLASAIWTDCAWTGTARADQLSEQSLYDEARILEVAIKMPEEDWQSLCAQTRDAGKVFGGKIEDPFTYFKGDITIDGQTIPSVGIRKKGFIGSLDDHFPSLKIRLDEYQDQSPIANVKVLTLNNNKQDAPLVTQFISYKLFNAAGVKAPRCNFARVTVNGEYLGIYSNVESIEKPFLKRAFGEASGNLYEGTLADFYPKAIDRLEVKTNKKNHDKTKINRLADLLAADGPLDLDAVSELVDVDNFLQYWALESLIGFWDGYCNNQNNYWVYENPVNGKFYFIPWGADATFMPGGFPGFGPRGPLSVYSESMLANRLYNHQAIQARYKTTLESIMARFWDEDQLIKIIDDYEQKLQPHLHQRQAGALRAMKTMRQFIKRRQKMLESEMEKWPVAAQSKPRKPMYIVPVGQASGSFTTTWTDSPPRDITKSGKLELQLLLDGEECQVDKLGVALHPPARSGFPGFGGPFAPSKPVENIVLSGMLADGDTKFQFTLPVPVEELEQSAGKTIQVDGTFTDDVREAGPFNPFSGRSVQGSLTFSKVSLKPGEVTEGEFELIISQVRGGFFDRGPR